MERGERLYLCALASDTMRKRKREREVEGRREDSWGADAKRRQKEGKGGRGEEQSWKRDRMKLGRKKRER